MSIKKILIANRGEIALRIIRSAREMNIKTVAVFSEADRNALHVKAADEAVLIGPAPSAESYLKMNNIIDAAKKVNADAIHPGYGFLSENADFVKEVEKAGLIFIGPSAESMNIMGSKLSAKAAAKKMNVPLVPGTDFPISDLNEARKIADEIGYPVLIKASAGGGGKGMRLVTRADDFIESAKRATSEAISAFGDGSVFIEKFIENPRHIEIQILGDKHGNFVYLFERECSIQRRHQKVVEEAPSSILTEAVRKKMGECAVAIAKEAGYFNAGTVEFLVDDNLNFYFLEMNTRLQVEHPVSEIITGLDLVKEQIKIASGQKLPFAQDDLKINGHVIEIRVYAEDPANNFLPDIGRLNRYTIPQGHGIRVDDAYEAGMEISIYYDPMIAKLITHGSDRDEAIKKMIRAIDDYKISGIATTLPFCKFVMKHEAFVSGKFDTNFVNKYFSPELMKETSLNTDVENEVLIAALLAEKIFTNKSNQAKNELQGTAIYSSWKKNRS